MNLSNSSSRPSPRFVREVCFDGKYAPTVKRLDTISPKLLIMFDTAHLGLCSSEMFKVATNIFLKHALNINTSTK